MLKGLKEAKAEIDNVESVRLVSHLDADGISAASILFSALSRIKKKVHLSLRKQLSSRVIDELKREKNELFLFADLGSGYLELLNELAESTGCKVIVCDHHIPSSSENFSNIIHINPILEDKDENEISGAGISYLLAKELGDNQDLSFLALVGAMGDMQDNDWKMNGINNHILEESINGGFLKREKGIIAFGRMDKSIKDSIKNMTVPFVPDLSGNEDASAKFISLLGIEPKKGASFKTFNDLSKDEINNIAEGLSDKISKKISDKGKFFGDIYSIEINGSRLDARELATNLNACGRMEQSSTGIISVLGLKPIEDMNGIVSGYRRMIRKYIGLMNNEKNIVTKMENAFYINGGNKIHENFIGTITSILERSSFFKERKPVFGISHTEEGNLKVSARAPNDYINKGLNLREMIIKIANNYGGYGGGHANAAGAFIPKGREKEFIDSCEKYLKDKLK